MNRNRVLALLLVLFVCILAVTIPYGIWEQPQLAPNQQVRSVQVVSTADNSTPAFVGMFAALDPGAEVALFENQSGLTGLEVAVPGIPPIGAYLPQTTQLEFPTPTPSPTNTPLPPTLTATVTLFPTPSPTPTLFPYTPNDGFASIDNLSPQGLPLSTDVAIADITDCAPLDVPVAGVLTQRFHRWHGGIDLGVHLNTPVLTTHTGTVLFSGWSDIGYGYLIIIQSGIFITYYGHLNAFNVSVGQVVGRGTIIGWSGSTGNSSGPHVHYEVRINDVPIDPLTFANRGYTSC